MQKSKFNLELAKGAARTAAALLVGNSFVVPILMREFSPWWPILPISGVAIIIITSFQKED